MAGVADDQMKRFLCLLEADEELTVSQLCDEAMAVKRCRTKATNYSVIKMLHILLKQMACKSLQPSEKDVVKYCAWISASEEHRHIFMDTVNHIAAEFFNDYSVNRVAINGDTVQMMTNEFLGLSSIINISLTTKSRFETAVVVLNLQGRTNYPPLDKALLNFLKRMQVFAFKTIRKILSRISVTKMRKSSQSDDEKAAIYEGGRLYYEHMLLNTGEVNEFMVTTDRENHSNLWINLWNKVHRTSDMDYLFSKATSLKCICGKRVDPGSTFIIMDNCYDLLCEHCARWELCVELVHRKCPVCNTPTEYWMSRNAFDELKTKIKKSTSGRTLDLPNKKQRAADSLATETGATSS